MESDRGRSRVGDIGTDKRYVRRDDEGKFIGSDDIGTSLASDVREQAKKKTEPGQDDRGSQKVRGWALGEASGVVSSSALSMALATRARQTAVMVARRIVLSDKDRSRLARPWHDQPLTTSESRFANISSVSRLSPRNTSSLHASKCFPL